MPYMCRTEQLATGLERVAAVAAEHGRPGVEGAVLCRAAVGRDAAGPRRSAVGTLGGVYRQDFGPIADRYIPTGTPEQVAVCPDGDRAAMVELFAAEVAPAVRSAA